MILYKILKANKSSFLLLVLLVLLPLTVSSSIGFLALKYEIYFRSFSILQWLLFYLMVSFTMALALTPTTFIALLSGYFLGWVSVPFMMIAYPLASFIGYNIARKIDHGKFLNSLKEIQGVDKIIGSLQNNEFMIIILSRLSPVLPFAMMNMLLSISGASLRNFLIAGFIGMLPRTLIFIWIGSEAKYFQELIENPSEDIWSQVLVFGLIFVSLFGLFYFFKKAVNKAAERKI